MEILLQIATSSSCQLKLHQDISTLALSHVWLLIFDTIYNWRLRSSIYILMSVRLWNSKDGGVLKYKIFAQESTCSKEIFLKQSYDELWFIIQSQFSMSKINQFFSKKIWFKNINLGEHFLVKTFFLDLIFEPLYFLKLRPIFDKLSLLVGIF